MNKQADIDWPTVAKLFAGGALTGAGLGAGTSLVRYLQTLNDKAKMNDTSQNDDVLYIKLPPKQQPMANRRAVSAPKYASANTASTFATGSMAGLLGTYLAYNAVRDAYQKHRKAQLQKELDSAQHIYLGNLSDQASMKQASQFGMMSKGIGTGYLALLLSALGSGVVANKMLGKFFPPVEPPFRDKPRKIVLQSDDPAKDIVDEPPGGVTPDEVEHLVRTTASSQAKEASMCGQIADLLAAASRGRCSEIRDNLVLGVDLMFDTVKGARFDKLSSVNCNLAATWLSTDPMVSEAIQPILAAAYYEMSPGIFDKAARIPGFLHKDLIDFTVGLSKEARKAVYAPIVDSLPSIKTAEVGLPMFLASEILPYALMSSSVHNALEENQDEKRKPNHASTPISKDSPDMQKFRQGNIPFEISGEDAKQFAEKYGPSIDTALKAS